MVATSADQRHSSTPPSWPSQNAPYWSDSLEGGPPWPGIAARNRETSYKPKSPDAACMAGKDPQRAGAAVGRTGMVNIPQDQRAFRQSDVPAHVRYMTWPLAALCG